MGLVPALVVKSRVESVGALPLAFKVTPPPMVMALALLPLKIITPPLMFAVLGLLPLVPPKVMPLLP